MIWAKLVTALALLAGLFGWGYRTGTSGTQDDWDAATARQVIATAAVEQTNRAIESARLTQTLKAQNDATIRNKALQVDANTARAVSVGLRDDIAAIRASLPELAADAVRSYADTVSVVLAECSDDYRAMAATADGHASDAQTLIDAWPTN
jgi:hypothetical protein